MFGKKLKVCRLSSGLTQQQLADKLGVSRSTISKYECGKRVPNDQHKTLLCLYLNNSTDFLLDLKETTVRNGDQLSPEGKNALISFIQGWFLKNQHMLSEKKKPKTCLSGTAMRPKKGNPRTNHRGCRTRKQARLLHLPQLPMHV